MTPGGRGETRSEAALAALQTELRRRAALLDADMDVVSVTLTLKFTAGSPRVRGTVWHEERVAREHAVNR